jgi:predicted PurR-regulated permease PerM
MEQTKGEMTDLGPAAPAPEADELLLPVGPAETPAVPVAVWPQFTRRVASVVLLLAGLWLVLLGQSVLQMLVMAAIIAFLLQPAVRSLEERGVRRPYSVLLVYLGGLALLALAVAVAVPQLAGEVGSVTGNLLVFAREGQARTEVFLEAIRRLSIAGRVVDLSSLVDPALGVVRNAEIPAGLIPSAERILGSANTVVRAASGVVLGVSNLLLTLLLTFFFAVRMSLDGAKLLRSVGDFFGESHSAEYVMLAQRVSVAWSGFFRGQVKLSLIIGGMVWIGALLLGLPGALFLGLLSAVMEVLPNVGAVLATIPALVVAFTQGSTVLPVSNLVFTGIVLLFYLAIHQLEGILFVPRVLGHAVDLPPLVVMVAVIVGFDVGGVLGAFIAVPVVATLREIALYAIAKIRGVDPYPELRPMVEPVTTAPPDPRPSANHC